MTRNVIRAMSAGVITLMVMSVLVPRGLAEVFAVFVGAFAWRYGPRMRKEADLVDERTTTREMPLALDVLALGLDAGISWDRAVTLAADCCSGTLARDLKVAAGRLAMGAAPHEVWVGSTPLLAIGEVVHRSFRSGAAVSTVIRRHVDTLRSDIRQQRLEASRRLATKIIMPVTFLGYPAFLCLGLLPTLISGFGHVVKGVLPTGFVLP